MKMYFAAGVKFSKVDDIYKIQNKKENQMPCGKANDSVKKEFCE